MFGRVVRSTSTSRHAPPSFRVLKLVLIMAVVVMVMIVGSIVMVLELL